MPFVPQHTIDEHTWAQHLKGLKKEEDRALLLAFNGKCAAERLSRNEGLRRALASWVAPAKLPK